MTIRVLIDGEPVPVTLIRGAGPVEAEVGDTRVQATVERRGEVWHLVVDGRRIAAIVIRDRDDVWIAVEGEIHRCTSVAEERTGAAASVRTPRVTAPMPGKVLDVVVREGQQVAAGDPLVILEAMKMETVATADAAGTVAHVHVTAGAMVEPGQTLVELRFDN